MCEPGYISGNTKAVIPWAKVIADPTAWIDENCYPLGFQWADPSKIRVGQVFQLLDHWRQRKADGHEPLIWNPSCDVLTRFDEQVHSQNARHRDQLSDEEDFAPELDAQDREEAAHPTPGRCDTFSDDQDMAQEWHGISEHRSGTDEPQQASPSPFPTPSPFRDSEDFEETALLHSASNRLGSAIQHSSKSHII